MPRYKLTIEYDGAPFAGWQRQNALATVQGTIEAALARLEPQAGPVFGAGRTDAGVHAMGQVAHCDLGRDWSPFRLAQALNHHLRPAPIAVIEAARAGADFHARFSAIQRHYRYRILCRRAPAVLCGTQVWQVPRSLDIAAMRTGAKHLIGHHDFTTFRSSQCQAQSPVKTLDRLDIVASGDEIVFDLSARSFLHNQVRSLIGTLERVGAGKWSPDRVAQALAARDRASCGPVAPQGLCLMRVDYPEDGPLVD